MFVLNTLFFKKHKLDTQPKTRFEINVQRRIAPRIWLITGTSSGIGSELAIKALAAGDRVIVTSRSVARLGHLEAKAAAPLTLDHNQSYEHVKAAVDKALELYGGVDILVNSAAYVQTGMVEETSFGFHHHLE